MSDVALLIATNALTLMVLVIVASLLKVSERETRTYRRKLATERKMAGHYLKCLEAAESALKWIEKEHGLDGDLEEREL